MLPSVVCPSVCRLSHSCTLLKPLDGMRCHLAGTMVWSQVTLCITQGPGPPPREKRRFGSEPPVRSDAAVSLFACLCLCLSLCLYFTNKTWQHNRQTIYKTGKKAKKIKTRTQQIQLITHLTSYICSIAD